MLKSGTYFFFALIVWILYGVAESSDSQSRGFCASALDKLDRIEIKLQSLLEKTTPPMFERIGTRYFYIENHVKLDWNSAQSTCVRKGGNLATFQNDGEFDAIQAKLKRNHYWLGINDRSKSDQFVSAASGRPVPFLKWGPGQPPHNYDKSESYVFMYDGKMGLWIDQHEFYFVCQADSM